MVRRITETVSGRMVRKDLETYRRKAVGLGASDAKVITTCIISVDERVAAKCVYPRCEHYGTNANCPPHAMSPDHTKKLVKKYKHAILFKVDVPTEHLLDPYGKGKVSRLKVFEITSKIEATAFYDGYYFAVGFGGSCKSAFCPKIECSALEPGRTCRQASKSRSSLEAVGIDAFGLAVKVGWPVYPIGVSTTPSEIPCGLRMGLVLIS